MKINESNMIQAVNPLQQNGIMNTAIIGKPTTEESSTAEISELGKRVGGMMERMGKNPPPPPPPKEKMDEIMTEIDALNLEELDLQEMTDDEIEEIASQIDAVMESYRPEGVTSPIDLSNMSITEKTEFVNNFIESSETMKNTLDKFEGMTKGIPPMGKRPPRPASNDTNQNAISAYESLQIEDEEDESLDILEKLIDALDQDALQENDEYSQFTQEIVDYLENKLL